MRSKVTMTLVKTRLGRVVLHTACLLQDRKLAWHWAGILRELRAQ